LVVLLCDVKNLRTELEIMNDFISFETNEHESEKRLLTNLMVSQFLCRNRTILSGGTGKSND
jgi:hypothetical protein